MKTTLTYRLRQAPDGTYTWTARAPERLWPETALPDMQLLGWAPDEIPALLTAAHGWLAEHGIDASVEAVR